ncbi:MAG: alpha/beta fold hydrolase [Flavobacteriaceae bacterium]|nr:alpha/beta fold hydrolase [Flavobacteriaceae bacterium]
MNPIQCLSISEIKTHTGASFANLDLYYQHFGLPLDEAPVVLINHSLTGDSDVAGHKGWWKELVGPEKTIDTNRYAILAFNIPGNGIEGQTLPNPEDFHTGDIADFFLKGLELLGISNLYALVGGSIGGGIAWEMAVLATKLTKYLIPIAADWKANDWILANTFLQKRILENSSNPLEDARIHAMLTYRTPKSFDHRFGRSRNEELGIFNIESWLLHHGRKLAERFHLDSYVLVNHLLASINIERDGKTASELISKIEAEIHLIAVDSDLFFTPEEDQQTFAMIKPNKDSIFYHELKSIHGHDAFLIENDAMEQILTPLFKNK